MDPKKLAHEFNLQIGKTKCSDNAYHDSTNCEECKILGAAAEQRRRKQREEKEALKAKEEAQEAARKKREEEDACKGNPCTNPRHYLADDKVHCKTDAEKEVRARVLYD